LLIVGHQVAPKPASTQPSATRDPFWGSTVQLREINQMEREMCQYLDWGLNIDPVTLKEFRDMIRKDFT
jgi:hypothetical protein